MLLELVFGTRGQVSKYVYFSAELHVAVALRKISGHFDQDNIVLTYCRLGLS